MMTGSEIGATAAAESEAKFNGIRVFVSISM